MVASHRFAHRAMATEFGVRLIHPDADYAAGAAQAAFARIDEIEAVLSRYQPGNDIAQLNQAEPGEWLLVAPDVQQCLLQARDLYHATEARFDPAFRTPGRFGGIEIDPAYPRVRLPQRMDIDLGGIGKGYALDEAGILLREWEVERALVQGGGSSVLALQPPPGKPGWALTVGQGPPIHLVEKSLSASGTEARGHHIVDTLGTAKGTGIVRTWALAPTATVSDALSTVFFLMSPDAIKRFCDQHPDIGAQWLITGPAGRQQERYGNWPATAGQTSRS